MIPRSGFGNLNPTASCAKRVGLFSGLADVIAYLTTQSTAVWLFHFWKRLINGKHLRLKENNGSGLVSQLLDSPGALIVLILNSYIFKYFLALAGTSFSTSVSGSLTNPLKSRKTITNSYLRRKSCNEYKFKKN